MVAADLAKAPLRLIALPLCRKPELIYYYAHKRKEPRHAAAATNTSTPTASGLDKGKGKAEQDASPPSSRDSAATIGTGSPADTVSVQQQQDVSFSDSVARRISKVTNYAAGKWEELGRAAKDSWKYKTYITGERLMDRIEYEEWLLKALDASTAPRLLRRRSPKVAAEPAKNEDGSSTQLAIAEQVPLYYPKSLIQTSSVISNLKRLLDQRQPHHKGLLKKSLLVVPLTFPFALIPVLPNLPMFYVLWRAWSHWRAGKSSEYLQGLIAHDQLAAVASDKLDGLYSSAVKDAQNPSSESQVILTHDMVDQLKIDFELDDQAGVDLRRAIAQAQARLKGDTKLYADNRDTGILPRKRLRLL